MADVSEAPAELTGQVPAPRHAQEQPLDARVIVVDRIGGAVRVAIFSGMLLLGALIAVLIWPVDRTTRLLIPAGWLVVTAALGAWSQWWPVVRFRHVAWRLDDQGWHIRRGVLWRSAISVPRSRVQHTDVSQGPIERYYELATVIAYTAGTEHAAIALSGLNHAVALRLRDHLLQGHDGADV
jgi:hypothetical protein